MSDDEHEVSPGGNDDHTPAGKFAPGNALGHRFAPGNKHGRGNPTAIRMHEHRMQFLDAIDAGTIPALARRIQAGALSGDEFSVKVLLDYCLGKPAQAVQLSGPDGEPLGVNFAAVTTIVLNALAGDEHAEARVRIAAQLMELGDVRRP